MTLSQRNLSILKQLIANTLQTNELVSHDVIVEGDKITFYLYNPEAPDLHSQDKVRITLELIPSLKQLKEDYPEVFI
jgi:hypothetical protein